MRVVSIQLLLRRCAAAALLPALTAAAFAQTPTETLPPLNVEASRIITRRAPVSTVDGGTIAAAPFPLPSGDVKALTPSVGIVGASTSVITAADIARSPVQNLPEIIAQLPGVQLQTLFGGVNGAGSVVDIRGFGAFAAQNTLILVNGRRINESDLQGVDLSTIPLQSIERIEVTRGNSAAVLYGDNAVGGVINIVTKVGIGGPPVAMRAEGGVGSFNQRLGNVSAATNSGPWSTSFFGNAITTDGYRVNNKLQQVNGVGDIRYTTPDFSAFVAITGDDQQLGFPGGRSTRYPLNGINQLATDPRGTSTPFDYGNKQGNSVTAGFTKTLWNGGELIVDGGVRNKKQQAGFFGDPADPFFAFNSSYVDSTLQTWSITPRLNIKNDVFGLRSTIISGIDFYDSSYNSERNFNIVAPPAHIYDINQQTVAGYWQQTIGLLPSTDFSYGGRIQNTSVTARDRYDPNAPFVTLAAQSRPLDQSETNNALHAGLEHRFNDTIAIFGRAAKAFRTPNVDERVITGPAFAGPPLFTPIPQNFQLRTQTSHDIEGGIKFSGRGFDLQTSFYDMRLRNEIQYNPVNLFNFNLDPTHRYGNETFARWRIDDRLQLKGSFAYTRAVFAEGRFTGNDVPLVSPVTASAGVSYAIWQRYLLFDATVRYWSARRFDNDQRNFQPLIPANATVDFKLSGEIDRFFWSLAVNNLFDTKYFDYGIASAVLTNVGVYNAYPLPGRNFLLKAGVTF